MFDSVLAKNASGDGTGMDNMTCIIATFDKHPLNGSKNHLDTSRPSTVENGTENGGPVAVKLLNGTKRPFAEVDGAHEGAEVTSSEDVKKKKISGELSV